MYLVWILHNKELRNLYKSCGIVIVVRYKMLRWAAIAQRIRQIHAFRIWWGKRFVR